METVTGIVTENSITLYLNVFLLYVYVYCI